MNAPNPMHVLFRQAMGIDAFSLDGDDTSIPEPWSDRPHLCKTPPPGQ